jgi:hypothetical protein
MSRNRVSSCGGCWLRDHGRKVGGAYWFTASISFANPAVTLARAFTDTFAGIRPADVLGFVVAQLLGAFAATILFRWLVPSLPSEAKDVVFPHADIGRQWMPGFPGLGREPPECVVEEAFHGLKRVGERQVFSACGRPKTRFYTRLRCSLRLNLLYCPFRVLTPF